MGVERVSKKRSADDEAESGEHKGHGPLAPWRLCIAVVLSADVAVTGMTATHYGGGCDPRASVATAMKILELSIQ